MAPALLKKKAKPLGNVTRQIVERIAVIMERVCQASGINTPLKLKAVSIPIVPVVKNIIRHEVLLKLSLKLFRSHDLEGNELFIFRPRPAATP